nr:class I SAM-dependent methyltransferase [Candidatus Delongbacteria bacterium]
MSRNNQYSQRFWDKKAYRYEKRALNKNSPSYISCLEFMKEAVEANAQVIDLGCGTGIMGEVLMDKVSSYLGIDISSGMISLAKGKKIKDNDNKMTFRKGDMHNTSLN